MPQVRYVEALTAQLNAGEVPVSDLRWLPGRHKHIALIPQWDFLGLVAGTGRREPAYDLVMNAAVTGLLREQGRGSASLSTRPGRPRRDRRLGRAL